MNATRKVKLKELTGNLTCNLCKGYFIDASTIIECLHSFCRTCIVKHLEKSEFCPVCDVQLHSSKPMTSVRSDHMLQEIVYKLVPGLFQNEMVKRRKFYKEHRNTKPTCQQDSGHVYNESYITSDDQIQLSLEYYTSDLKFRESSKRYIKCPAAVSISILKKLIYNKYDLNKSVDINVMYGDRILPDDFLLMDIAYKYSWTQNGKPLQLCYVIEGDTENSRFTHRTSNKSTHLPLVTTPVINKRRQSNKVNTSTHIMSNVRKPTKLDKREKSLTKEVELNHSIDSPSLLNGKISGKTSRKRKKLSSDIGTDCLNIVKTNESWTQEVEKSKPATPILANIPQPLDTVAESNTEVQLMISENGVISARSVSSGQEKIIIKTPVKYKPSYSLNRSMPSRPIEFLLNTAIDEEKTAKLSPIDITKSHSTPKIRKYSKDANKSISQEKSTPREKPKSLKRKADSTLRPTTKSKKIKIKVEGEKPKNFIGENTYIKPELVNLKIPIISPSQSQFDVQNGQQHQDPLNQMPNHYLNPLPPPNKQLNTASAINGDIEVTNKSSSPKSYSSPSKTLTRYSPKPNKVVNSNPSESKLRIPIPTTPIKLNGSVDKVATNGHGFKTSIKIPEKNVDQRMPTSSKRLDMSELPTNTTHMLNGIGHGHRFTEGLGLDGVNLNMSLSMNMNLGMSIGGINPHLVPFLTSNYCSMPMPYFSNPRTTTNPTFANGLSMSLPFSYSNLNAHFNHNQPVHDLPGKKQISNFVSISPKKCFEIGNNIQEEPLSLKINQSPKQKSQSSSEILSSPGKASMKHQQQKINSPVKSTAKKVPQKISKMIEYKNGNTNNNNGEANNKNKTPSLGIKHPNATETKLEPSNDKMEIYRRPGKLTICEEDVGVKKEPSQTKSLYSINSISDFISSFGSTINDNNSGTIVDYGNSNNEATYNSSSTMIPASAAIVSITSSTSSTDVTDNSIGK